MENEKTGCTLCAPVPQIPCNRQIKNIGYMILTQGSKVQGKRINLVQGSDEWLSYRRSKVCASDSPIIMELSPWRTRDELLKEKLGLIESQPVNNAMKRGMILEPAAVACAEEMLGTLFIAEVLQSIEHSWMCASYDGVCIDNKIILEVKCTNKKNHELAKNGQIPDYYMPQVQHQIAVSGVDQCHYESFVETGKSPVTNLPIYEGIIVVVDRDDKFIKRMIEMEYEFYQEMTDA